MRAAWFVALAGCSSILGIGDLPAPVDPDSGPDGPTCMGNTEACGATCIDLQTSVDHCGACDLACPIVSGGARSCEAGLCRLDVDEAVHAAWTVTAPGPFLGFWKDGTLLASNGSSASVLIPPVASPTAQPFTALAGRHTIVIPTNTQKPEVALSHFGFYEGRKQIDMQAWMNDINGCCGTTPDGFAADPVLGRMFTGHGVTELDTETGMTAKTTDTQIQHGSSFYVTASALYLPRRDTAIVTKYDRNHAVVWSLAMSATAGVTVGEAAIASDGGIVVGSAMGDKLTRFLPTGVKAWEIDVVAPGAPITTSTGLVIVGATKGGDPHLCAFDLGMGTERWCTKVDAKVIDAIAGSDGVIYVSLDGITSVLGLDRATGVVRYTFRNVTPPQELLLRAGKLYVSGSGAVTAIDVPATSYDASSWPVRFHDNQRTRGTQATLEF